MLVAQGEAGPKRSVWNKSLWAAVLVSSFLMSMCACLSDATLPVSGALATFLYIHLRWFLVVYPCGFWLSTHVLLCYQSV